LVQPVDLPSDLKSRLQYLFNIKKRFFYEELIMWVKDLFNNSKEMDEALLKNTKIIQEKLSKACYEGFSAKYRAYLHNIVQDKNSNANIYYARYYVSKY
jgi:hypothetical protein